MKRLHPAKEPTCADCGNEDDLDVFEGRLLCRPCRTCPHGVFYTEDGAYGDDVPGWQGYGSACNQCLLELHTVQSMTGPFIADLVGYAVHAEGLGMESSLLVAHTLAEADWLAGYDDSPEGKVLYERFTERAGLHLETGSATARGTPASPSERSGTSPCRLLHRLARRRTW